jgi:hypothetical protein
MTDVTVKTFDELDDYAGQFLYAGKGLGVTAWGMNVERLPAHWDEFPHHDHAENGQEVHADGQTWDLERGTLARVGPGAEAEDRPGGGGRHAARPRRHARQGVRAQKVLT